MADEQAETTLRETISQAFDEHVAPETVPQSTVANEQPKPSVVGKEEPVETEDQKVGRTAGRPRDEKGRLLPGPAKKETAPVAATATTVPQPPAAAPAQVAVPRPSSWKKDYEPKWATLDPELQKYIIEREGQFASGVSTYKREWEQAKPLMDAIQPFMPELQKHNINPGQWISNLGRAHQMLATGQPAEKLSMFLKLAQDYQVPVEQLFTQQDGKVFYNPQVQQLPQVQQPAFNPQMIEAQVQAVIQKERSAAEIQSMAADTVNYPHFEALRLTMAQLLDAGTSKDLKDAYGKALRLNDELWQSEQEAKARRDADAVKAKAQADAQRARQTAVSPRSATPAAKTAPDKKGLRAQLEESFDQHVQEGRV